MCGEQLAQLSHIRQIYLFLHLRSTLSSIYHQSHFLLYSQPSFKPACFHSLLYQKCGEKGSRLPAPWSPPIVGIRPATPWNRSPPYSAKEYVGKSQYGNKQKRHEQRQDDNACNCQQGTNKV